ncbi:kinase-like domain-containing protein [Chytridium lagenaria]|nr:kinase-like domain-containing protein [Chytridium lagenaria]
MLDKKSEGSSGGGGGVSTFLRGLHNLKSQVTTKSNQNLIVNDLPGQPHISQPSTSPNGSLSRSKPGTPDKHSSLPPLQLKHSKSDLRNPSGVSVTDPATAALLEGLSKTSGAGGEGEKRASHGTLKKSNSSGSLMNGGGAGKSARTSKASTKASVANTTQNGGKLSQNRRSSIENTPQYPANSGPSYPRRSQSQNYVGGSNPISPGLTKSRVSSSHQGGLIVESTDSALFEEEEGHDKVSELNLAASQLQLGSTGTLNRSNSQSKPAPSSPAQTSALTAPNPNLSIPSPISAATNLSKPYKSLPKISSVFARKASKGARASSEQPNSATSAAAMVSATGTIGGNLGPALTGGFASVFLVRLKSSTGRYYALKAIKKSDVLRLKQEKQVMNEKNILKNIRHSFIVELYQTFQDTFYLYMRFAEEDAKFYVSEVLISLQYLHSENIVYQILLDTTGHIKLADFGFAKIVRSTTQSFCGTPDYIAAEVVANHPYTKAVDWWSFGVLVFELVSGKTPFGDDTSEKIYDNITAGRIKWHPTIKGSCKDVIKRLLDLDPSRRLGSNGDGAEIRAHPWFKNVNWKKVEARQATPPFLPACDTPDVIERERAARETPRTIMRC